MVLSLGQTQVLNFLSSLKSAFLRNLYIEIEYELLIMRLKQLKDIFGIVRMKFHTCLIILGWLGAGQTLYIWNNIN